MSLSADLAAACNALGSFDPKTDQYYADDNILECVKDLIRYLRRDTERYEVRLFFGQAKILEINLIPLLKSYWEQTDFFDVLLRLLGNLTSPVLLLYNEEIPTDRTERNRFLQILGHLQSYKEAFADYDLWALLCTRLSQLLNIEWQERGEENGLIIERILILVRNVLHVPADPDAEKRPDNDVSAHDKVIWSLRKSGLVDIILYMVSSDQEEPYYMYLLEILSLMLREHRPADLANAALTRTESEKAQDEAEFLAVRQQETTRRNERMKSFTSARHSRFGGTFVFKNVKSVNDNQELIYHKPLNKANVLDFDSEKTKVKVPKNRQPMQETNSFRRSTFSIRLLLKDFCIEFLNAGYNRLMQNVRGKLVRGRSVTNDETYYLWALKFFMEFNRNYKFDVKLVSETMSVQIFHYVQQQMEHNFDMVTSDKKKWPLWSKRLHLAVQAYKELLLNLNTMDKSTDPVVLGSAKVIKSNVFYVLEYREFILTLFLTYNPLKMSDAYLLDLIETQHIFLKMLQSFCGQDSSVVVQRKQRMKRKKKKVQKPVPETTLTVDEILESKWDELGPQISTVLAGGQNIPIVVPFDASSEVPIDEQKKDAMVKIQNFMRDNEVENAIGLLRAARDVWPENDSFGNASMAPEEEFIAMREIFFAELEGGVPAANLIPPSTITDVNNSDEEENEEFDEEDDLQDGLDEQIEVDFKFQDFANRFAHPKVVQACGLALRHFDTNTANINHCVLKLLHRISWDCRMPAMIFQASIFRSFQRIFAERQRPQYKELVKFATYIVRQFVKVTEKNKKVFMELLFWKNSKEAFDIEEGYGSYHEKSKTMKNFWPEEQEEELRMLVAEHRENQVEDDPVDWILNNLVDNTKTRRMVIKKLKALELLDYKGPKKSSGTSRPAKEFSQEEISDLTELYNQFKEANDPMGCIMDLLQVKRPRARVVQQLLGLGLIHDAKEMRKKRGSKRQEDRISYHSNIQLDADSDSSCDDNSRQKSIQGNESIRKRISKPKQCSSKSGDKRNMFTSQTDINAVKKIILDVIHKDMTESIKWIIESLNDALEDLDSYTDEGIPLVAIGEQDVSAMDDSIFKKMLITIGIKKPANEQEIYWRIPGDMNAQQIQKIVSVLNEVLEKGSAAIEPEPPAAHSSDDDDVFSRLRNFITKSDDDNSDSNNHDITAVNHISNTEQIEIDVDKTKEAHCSSSKENTTIQKRRIQTINDSSDESVTETLTDDAKQNTLNKNTLIIINESLNLIEKTSVSSKKRIQTMNDSSDESGNETNIPEIIESDKENDPVIKVNSSGAKKRIQTINDSSDESDSNGTINNRVEVNDSDTELANEDISDSKRIREHNSDSDSQSHVPKKKKIALIDSDED